MDLDKIRAGKTRLNAGLVGKVAKRGIVGEVGSRGLIVALVVLVLALLLVR